MLRRLTTRDKQTINRMTIIKGQGEDINTWIRVFEARHGCVCIFSGDGDGGDDDDNDDAVVVVLCDVFVKKGKTYTQKTIWQSWQNEWW